MICQRCRTSILSRLHHSHRLWSASFSARQPISSSRNYSDGSAPETSPPPPTPREPVVGGISVVTREPGADTEKRTRSSAAQKRPESSCPAGEKMSGLNYLKNKPDVYAKEDGEYPEWLWGVLDVFKARSKASSGGVDMSST